MHQRSQRAATGVNRQRRVIITAGCRHRDAARRPSGPLPPHRFRARHRRVLRLSHLKSGELIRARGLRGPRSQQHAVYKIIITRRRDDAERKRRSRRSRTVARRHVQRRARSSRRHRQIRAVSPVIRIHIRRDTVIEKSHRRSRTQRTRDRRAGHRSKVRDRHIKCRIHTVAQRASRRRCAQLQHAIRRHRQRRMSVHDAARNRPARQRSQRTRRRHQPVFDLQHRRRGELTFNQRRHARDMRSRHARAIISIVARIRSRSARQNRHARRTYIHRRRPVARKRRKRPRPVHSRHRHHVHRVVVRRIILRHIIIRRRIPRRRNKQHSRTTRRRDAIPQSLTVPTTAPTIAQNVRPFCHAVINALNRIRSISRAARAQELQPHQLHIPSHAHNLPCIIRRRADRPRAVSSVIVVVHRIPTVSNPIDAMNIIDIAIRIIVDSISGDLPWIYPNVPYQILMRIANARIHNTHNHRRRTRRHRPRRVRIHIHAHRAAALPRIPQPPKTPTCISRVRRDLTHRHDPVRLHILVEARRHQLLGLQLKFRARHRGSGALRILAHKHQTLCAKLRLRHHRRLTQPAFSRLEFAGIRAIPHPRKKTRIRSFSPANNHLPLLRLRRQDDGEHANKNRQIGTKSGRRKCFHRDRMEITELSSIVYSL